MCMIRLICVVDVEAITFLRCRAANPAGQYFTMNTTVERDCSAGQVIRVQSALLGYSVSYNPYSNQPHCSWSNCTKSTDVPASLCDGRTYCRIRQTILNSPDENALCALQKHGNFIRVEFTCGMISLSFPYYLEHFSNFFSLYIVTLSDDRWTKLLQSVISKVLIKFTRSTVCMKFRYFNYFTLGQRT